MHPSEPMSAPAPDDVRAPLPAWLPARPALFVLALWWGLRVLGLMAMRAFVDLEVDPVELGSGFALDGLMVAALVAPAAAARNAAGGARRGWLFAAWPLATSATFFRAADVVTCYFALAHANESTWAHVSAGSIGYLADPRLLAAFAAVASAGAAIVWMGWRDGAHRALRPSGAAATLAVVAAVVTTAAATGDWHPHHLGLLPEVQVAASGIRAKLIAPERVDPRRVVVAPLAAEHIGPLRAAGVLPPRVEPANRYPLVREDLGTTPALPRRATSAVAPIGQGRPPNVLVILVESLSAGFTSLHAASRHRTLMPELEKFAASHTDVRGFHNATSPTANGLIASLCATLPPAAVGDLEVGGSVDGQTPYRCLADVLREHGYHSEFVRGASKIYMACEATLRGHGFDAVWGREDLQGRYPDRKQNAWGFDDATLVDFLLDRIDALRKSPEPWMLATLTVGTHLPGFPDEGCAIPAAVRDQPLLAGYACSDAQLGRLLRTLDDRGVLADTLVVITGDHAQLPTPAVKALIGVPELAGSFAPMPLLLSDPLHALPARVEVPSSQLDLVPTILHLLGAPSPKHSFLGYSIFGERPAHPFLYGRIGQRLVWARHGEHAHEMPQATLARRCREGRPLLEDAEGHEAAPVGPCALQAFLDWLDALWRGHRLFPAEEYHGAEGSNAELLRLRWLRYDAKEARQRARTGQETEHGGANAHPGGPK